METTLNIESIQYINLLRFMTGVGASDCFEYNFSLIFVISPNLVKIALNNNGEKIKLLSEKIRKNVKIVSMPQNKSNAEMEKFILSVVFPLKFKRIIVNNGEMIINASPEIKAKLIGRNSARLNELEGIVKKYFDIKKILIR